MDMQTLVDALRVKGKIYKKIQEITPKELGIRNKIKLYNALDTSNKYSIILIISQKSRILQKDVEKFETIFEKMGLFCDRDFTYKHIFIDAPLCSKAKVLFEQHGWKIH